jgi:hypothetical protein
MTKALMRKTAEGLKLVLVRSQNLSNLFSGEVRRALVDRVKCDQNGFENSLSRSNNSRSVTAS